MMSAIVKTISMFAILTVVFAGAYNYYQNNKTAAWPSSNQIDTALTKSVNWLHANKSTVEADHNPGLWWMLKEASVITTNTDLKEIYRNYKESYLDKQPLNVWSPYFLEYYKSEAPDILEISDISDYQKFFIYALSCDNDLASEPIIMAQMEPGFCSLHYLHPRCVTHQQMGVRLLQKRDCGDQNKLSSLSAKLINTIYSELTWDFRVGDAYLQRVLMLAETGKAELIKPVWIQRILEAQNPDGGWDDIHPVITFANDTIMGLSTTKPVLEKSRSSFHATAQGIWLLSLLQQYETNNNSR